MESTRKIMEMGRAEETKCRHEGRYANAWLGTERQNAHSIVTAPTSATLARAINDLADLFESSAKFSYRGGIRT
jgi:hypothetical protein